MSPRKSAAVIARSARDEAIQRKGYNHRGFAPGLLRSARNDVRQADRIRDELAAIGIAVRDNKAGRTHWT